MRVHGDYRSGYQFSMSPHRHMPRFYPHQVVKGEFQNETALSAHLKRELLGAFSIAVTSAYLSVHWLAMISYHCALVTVQCD